MSVPLLSDADVFGTSSAATPTLLSDADVFGTQSPSQGGGAMLYSAPHPTLGSEGTAVVAGGDRGLANLFGLPVDAMNAGLGMIGAGSDKPVGGSEWLKDRFGDVIDVGHTIANALGAAPAQRSGREVIDQRAQTPPGRVLARAAEDVAGMAVPMAGALAIPSRGLSRAAGAVRETLAGTSNADRAAQALASAGAGVAAGSAQEVVPNNRGVELAAGLLGGIGTGAGIAAAEGAASSVAPFVSRDAREAAAAAAMRRFSANKEGLDLNLATAPAEVIPGSRLTTAQATGDVGLAGLERTLRNDPEFGPQFAKRDAKRSLAQRNAVNAAAPAGEGAVDAAALANDRLQQFRNDAGAIVDRARAGAGQALDTVGGTEAPSQYGAVIRDALQGARNDAAKPVNDLWQGAKVADDKGFAVANLRDAAQQMLGEISPLSGQPSGPVAGILQAAAGLGDVVPFKDVRQFRQLLTNTADQLKRSPDLTAPADLRRVQAVLSGLDGDLEAASSGAVKAPASTPSPAAAPIPDRFGYIRSLTEKPATAPPLHPTFDSADAQAFADARAATATLKGTFDRGAVGKVLDQGGYAARGPAGYAMPDETVASTFFNRGKVAQTDVADFLKAAGGRPQALEALQQYAAADLRRVAAPDGMVNPARWRTWMDQHIPALRAFPELVAKLNTAAGAQELVSRLAARQAAAESGFKASPAGKLLGGADPDRAFASILESRNATQGLTQLLRMNKGDPAPIQRAVIDYMMRRIENPGSVDALGNSPLSKAKLSNVLNKLAPALRQSGVFSEAHLSTLRKIEADLARGVFSTSAGRAPGSNTVQNLSGAALLDHLGLGRLADATWLQGTLGRGWGLIMKTPDEKIRELLAEAMLDPGFAKALASRHSPDRAAWIARSLKRRLVATTSAEAAETNRKRP